MTINFKRHLGKDKMVSILLAIHKATHWIKISWTTVLSNAIMFTQFLQDVRVNYFRYNNLFNKICIFVILYRKINAAQISTLNITHKNKFWNMSANLWLLYWSFTAAAVQVITGIIWYEFNFPKICKYSIHRMFTNTLLYHHIGQKKKITCEQLNNHLFQVIHENNSTVKLLSNTCTDTQ